MITFSPTDHEIPSSNPGSSNSISKIIITIQNAKKEKKNRKIEKNLYVGVLRTYIFFLSFYLKLNLFYKYRVSKIYQSSRAASNTSEW